MIVRDTGNEARGGQVCSGWDFVGPGVRQFTLGLCSFAIAAFLHFLVLKKSIRPFQEVCSKGKGNIR